MLAVLTPPTYPLAAAHEECATVDADIPDNLGLNESKLITDSGGIKKILSVCAMAPYAMIVSPIWQMDPRFLLAVSTLNATKSMPIVTPLQNRTR